MKLNTKKLYMADGHAVKEMLKISTLLHTAMTTHQVGGRQTLISCRVTALSISILSR